MQLDESLSVVERLVKLHGGTVSVSSGGTGQGSQFTIRLPAVTAPRHHVSEQTEIRNEAAQPCRVLVVDDNEDSVESLAMLLRMLGHEVATANDGEQALTVAEGFRPDVAILDIGLPKLNGYDLAKQMRARPWARDVVLVALTGWGQDQHRRRSAESGFNHHLTKPVELEVLQQILTATEACLPARDQSTR